MKENQIVFQNSTFLFNLGGNRENHRRCQEGLTVPNRIKTK